MARYKQVNGQRVQFTAEEETARDTEEQAWADGAFDREIGTLRETRTNLLKETDFYALQDVTMSEDMTTYRQALRDIPQNNTTEEQYDLLLARVDGQLTHEIWSKP